VAEPLFVSRLERFAVVGSTNDVVRDWLAAFGVYLLNGLAFLATGFAVFWLRPESRQSRAVLAFGVALATAATFLFAYFVNVVSAALALAGFYFYVFVYTRWLKRTTPQNIVIGGAAGAFPPLVGWAAVTGGLDLVAVYLFLIIFYWTPPHFWSLAIACRDDYAAARVPMLPIVVGDAAAARAVFTGAALLVVVSIVPGFLGMSWLYVVAAVAGGALLLWRTAQLVDDPTRRRARGALPRAAW